MDKEGNSDSVDAEAGVLQSEDMVLNQSLLQNALKKDMQRLSRVNSSNSMYTAERISHANNNGNIENNTRNKGNAGGSNDDFTAPISATAKMMMKLYGDKTLMERDLNKHHNKTKKAQNKNKVGFKFEKILICFFAFFTIKKEYLNKRFEFAAFASTTSNY